mmetsp:Transcript_103887/g.334829  ORF Transcript_103887/g.334829 Transcript_103887/m.334829 type:complete len:231 (-) Transcript_103887:331-1023(-)
MELVANSLQSSLARHRQRHFVVDGHVAVQKREHGAEPLDLGLERAALQRPRSRQQQRARRRLQGRRQAAPSAGLLEVFVAKMLLLVVALAEDVQSTHAFVAHQRGVGPGVQELVQALHAISGLAHADGVAEDVQGREAVTAQGVDVGSGLQQRPRRGKLRVHAQGVQSDIPALRRGVGLRAVPQQREHHVGGDARVQAEVHQGGLPGPIFGGHRGPGLHERLDRLALALG